MTKQCSATTKTTCARAPPTIKRIGIALMPPIPDLARPDGPPIMIRGCPGNRLTIKSRWVRAAYETTVEMRHQSTLSDPSRSTPQPLAPYPPYHGSSPNPLGRLWRTAPWTKEYFLPWMHDPVKIALRALNVQLWNRAILPSSNENRE